MAGATIKIPGRRVGRGLWCEIGRGVGGAPEGAAVFGPLISLMAFSERATFTVAGIMAAEVRTWAADARAAPSMPASTALRRPPAIALFAAAMLEADDETDTVKRIKQLMANRRLSP